MKILLLGQTLCGDGVGTMIFNLYSVLTAAGHSCDVALFTIPDINSQPYKILLKNHSQIFKLPRLSHQGPLCFLQEVRRICRENKYDVIHIHIGLFIWLAALAAKVEKVPVRVGHAHGEKFGKWWYSKIFLKIFSLLAKPLNCKYCTTLLTCSQRSALATFGKNVHLFPNFILPHQLLTFSENDIQKKRLELVSERNAFICGYMGALNSLKNVLFLPLIIYELRRKNIPAYLLIIGGGELETPLRKQISKLGLDSYVLLLGKRTDTALLVQTFDAYLSASTSEGMSMSMLEAQVCGKACFVSDSIPKASDMGIGLFYQIKGNSPRNWATEIINIINTKKPFLSRSLALEKAQQNGFSEEKIVKELISLYHLEDKSRVMIGR